MFRYLYAAIIRYSFLKRLCGSLFIKFFMIAIIVIYKFYSQGLIRHFRPEMVRRIEEYQAKNGPVQSWHAKHM